MTRLEKVVQLMHEDDTKSTIWIKCTNISKFINIVDIIEKSNQHTLCHGYLKEVFCFNNNTVFIQASKNVTTQLIDIKFFDAHYGNKAVNDIDCLRELDDSNEPNKVKEPEMCRALDLKIEELFSGNIKQIAIDVVDFDRLNHIVEIINDNNLSCNYTELVSPKDYLNYMKKDNQYLHVYLDKDRQVRFKQCCKENYEQWEIIRDADILKPVATKESLCPNVVHALDAIYNNNNAENMIDNFFNAMLGQSEKQTKQNNSGEKRMKKDVLKVFDKGQVDIKQVIVQMYLKDLTSNVPFVNELVRKELARIKNEIVTNFTPIHNLDTFNLKFLATVDYLEDIKNCDSVVDLECAYMFYTYEKEIAKELLTNKVDYSWIKDFLTQKNVMSSKRIDLFKSGKFQIFIEDGSIHFVDMKTNMGYSIDIKYDEAEKTFHL